MENQTPKPSNWYEFARITDPSGDFNETCEVPQAEAMLKAGLLSSFDHEADLGYCVEKFFTVIEANESAVWAWLQENPVRGND